MLFARKGPLKCALWSANAGKVDPELSTLQAFRRSVASFFRYQSEFSSVHHGQLDTKFEANIAGGPSQATLMSLLPTTPELPSNLERAFTGTKAVSPGWIISRAPSVSLQLQRTARIVPLWRGRTPLRRRKKRRGAVKLGQILRSHQPDGVF